MFALLAACGSSGGDKAGGNSEKSPEDALKAAEADVAAATKLVAEPWKGKVKFTATLTDGKRAAAVVPDGWTKGSMKGELQPPQGSGLGFFTRMRISHTCQGDCVARDDWSPQVTAFYDTFAKDTKPTKDEKVGTNGRVVVKKIESTKTLDTIYTVWSKGGMNFFICQVTLSEEAVALQPAFEKACTSLAPLRWDNASD